MIFNNFYVLLFFCRMGWVKYEEIEFYVLNFKLFLNFEEKMEIIK